MRFVALILMVAVLAIPMLGCGAGQTPTKGTAKSAPPSPEEMSKMTQLQKPTAPPGPGGAGPAAEKK